MTPAQVQALARDALAGYTAAPRLLERPRIIAITPVGETRLAVTFGDGTRAELKITRAQSAAPLSVHHHALTRTEAAGSVTGQRTGAPGPMKGRGLLAVWAAP